MPSSRPRPLPAELTWQQAEEAAARHMREVLMFSNVRVSAPGADNGIDVWSREGIAQVKWYTTPVGIAEVQRLRGTVSGTQWAVFYASIYGFTKAAKEAATSGNVALFCIVTDGAVAPMNHVAESLLRMRLNLPPATDPNGDLTMGERFASYRRLWALEGAIREHEGRVTKLLDAVDRMQGELRSLERHDPAAADHLRRTEIVWSDDAQPPELDEAASAFRRMTRLDPDLAGDVRAQIVRAETVLPQLPALVEALIAAAPVPREQLNDWCDRWEEWSFQAQFRPLRVMPRSSALREMLEAKIARGPSRSDLERHAKQMAIRVVQ